MQLIFEVAWLAEERLYTTIKDLPVDERPRERLAKYGAEALSNAELLAIMLRVGSQGMSAIDTAELLLARFGGLRGIISASVEELVDQIKGLGPAKAVQIKAAVEIGRRIATMPESTKPCIRSPQDVANLVSYDLRTENREHFIALFLDTRNQVLRRKTISIGGLDASLIHPRELFKEAIACGSASVIVCHNHPSGDPTPSQEDLDVTQRLLEAGKIIGIEVLDHLVVGDGKFISLKDKGLM
jgi:DNA repair protein RadC